MKVLHVIPAVAPCYGGPSNAIGPMCRALVARGVEPLIATTDADGAGRLQVPIGETTSWQGVPALFFKRDLSESFKYSRGLATWLRTHTREFDVVHVHSLLSHAPLAAAAACRRGQIPYVVRPLGTMAPWSLAQKPWRKRALLALGARRVLREAAAVHYTSEEEQLDTEPALGATRGVVIPLGVAETGLNNPIVSVADRERTPYVLSLSRLHPKKNLEILIKSFAAIDGYPHWRLIIAGSGDDKYARSLERLAQDCRLEARVTFAGWVEGAAKRDLMSHASLFAMPSLHENFGVSLVEALADGVPVLVSREVNMAKAVASASAGWVVDADVESLRCGLIGALTSAEERLRRGHAARQLAQRFAWPGVAGQLVDLYERLVRSHGHPVTA